MYVDVLAGCVHWLDPRTGSHDVAPLDQHIGAIGLAGQGYVVAAKEGILLYTDGNLSPLAPVLRSSPHERCNDAAVGPDGGFWVGIMRYDVRPGSGRLVRCARDGDVSVAASDLTLPNGIGWSVEGTTMYLADSGTGRVDRHTFDPATGELGDAEPFVECGPGVPDGLTVDRDGNVWIAIWGGGRVDCYSPNARLTMRIDVPTPNVTACCFGGDDLDVMYITSATHSLTAAELARDPNAGAVFVVDDLGTRGSPSAMFDVG